MTKPDHLGSDNVAKMAAVCEALKGDLVPVDPVDFKEMYGRRCCTPLPEKPLVKP